MKQPEPLPIEAREAARRRLWARLLADPVATSARPTADPDTRDKGEQEAA